MQRWTQAAFLSNVTLILVLGTGCGSKPENRPVASSGVTLAMLRPGQAEALALTGKVWGFLKYHHPAVTAGRHDWDAALLRMLPEVLAAPQADEVQRTLRQWIDRLGPIDECRDCVTLEARALQTAPRLQWMQDVSLLGPELSARLQTIYRNRVPWQQHHVRFVQWGGYPEFVNEAAYGQLRFPDSGYQILAVFRFWNIAEYWFPYRELIDENWDDVLLSTLRTAAISQSRDQFEREMHVLIARADDSHASLWAQRVPTGKCLLPVALRHIDGEFVVAGFLADETAAAGMRRGDVLLTLDGIPVTDIVAKIRRYYGGSNDARRMLEIARNLGRGACGKTKLGLRRDGELQIEATRLPFESLDTRPMDRNDRPGPSFQKLSPQVAYLKLSTVEKDELSRHVEEAAGTRLLILDQRNYPASYLVHELGALFVDAPTPFVTFARIDLSNPGAFFWAEPDTLKPRPPHYKGKVAILVDENTMSLGEYTAMAVRASPRARVFGTITAGADGTLCLFSLPGGMKTGVSGVGIFYPDRRPTQQVGIVPDVVCKPTIAGLKEGRDEVLDCALRHSQVPQ